MLGSWLASIDRLYFPIYVIREFISNGVCDVIFRYVSVVFLVTLQISSSIGVTTWFNFLREHFLLLRSRFMEIIHRHKSKYIFAENMRNSVTVSQKLLIEIKRNYFPSESKLYVDSAHLQLRSSTDSYSSRIWNMISHLKMLKGNGF